MRSPLHTRHHIHFYCEKPEAAFRLDPYERYDEMVVRQTALHLADQLWDGYPFQPVLDWVLEKLDGYIDEKQTPVWLDIGCGVGRLIGEIAQRFPAAQCWGMDYSYQMLRRAHEYWLAGQTIELDAAGRGFPPCQLTGKALSNLSLGLTRAKDLPFADDTIHGITHSFLLDRTDDPLQALTEMYRVLAPEGKMLMVSPLNFQKKEHWQQFFPTAKLIRCVQSIGFRILDFQDNWIIEEPLDFRGNSLRWKCLRLLAKKG